TRLYGAVLRAGGSVDEPATAAERSRRFADRRRHGRSFAPLLAQAAPTAVIRVLHPIGEMVELVQIGEKHYCRCRRCAWVIAPASENYKARALYAESDLPAIDPALFLDPATQVDERIVFRTYFCPGCGVLFEGDLCRPDDPPVWDVEI